MIAIAISVAVLGRFGLAVFLLSAFLLEWLYPVIFEVLGGGATPGKRAIGLIVLNDDGTPVRWPASLTRNLLRALDFLPFKRLGDLAANTLVVYREQKPTTARIPESEPVAPLVPLSLSEQRTLLDFAERSGRITPDRAAELAEIVSPLASGQNGTTAVDQIVGIANHLVGRR
jgi:hypothetical protein